VSQRTATKKYEAQILKKSALTKQEIEIMQTEMRDETASQRYLPIFNTMLLTDPDLRALLFDPFRMTILLDSVSRNLKADMSLRGKKADFNTVLDLVIKQLAPGIEMTPLLGILLTARKKIKIKKEKKALLWVIGELIMTITQKHNPADSATIRMMVLASIQATHVLMDNTNQIITGKEPYSFDYAKFLNGADIEAEFERLIPLVSPHEPDLSLSVSSHSLELLTTSSQPFGLRFHQIIHYPIVGKLIEKKRILLPGQSQAEGEEELDDTQFNQFVTSLGSDMQLWSESFQTRVQLMKEVIDSAKRANFDRVNQPEFQTLLSATAYSLLFFVTPNPFLIRLYKQSGEKADQINPEDEKMLIIDMKSAPDNPRLYRKYADLLYEKNEMRGALNVYQRVMELLPEPDVDVTARIAELEASV
jgi:hypothetical protein